MWSTEKAYLFCAASETSSRPTTSAIALQDSSIMHTSTSCNEWQRHRFKLLSEPLFCKCFRSLPSKLWSRWMSWWTWEIQPPGTRSGGWSWAISSIRYWQSGHFIPHFTREAVYIWCTRSSFVLNKKWFVFKAKQSSYSKPSSIKFLLWKMFHSETFSL